jgi:hypothetical protein
MKVCIVGGCPSSEYLAPFNDESWEIWVLGNQYDRHQNRRVTRLFEIHDNLTEHDESYPQWLVDQELPLVIGKQFPITSPYAMVFPEKEANELLGGEFLSSSPAYMMALAILEEAEEIAIYGVDMAVDNHEYFKQRPEMYAWIALAKARGIKVTIPDESPLFKGGYVEGRDWGGKPETAKPPFTEFGFEEMAQKHIDMINGLEDQKRQIEDKIHSHDGARQIYERLAKVARATEAGIEVNSLLESSVIK